MFSIGCLLNRPYTNFDFKSNNKVFFVHSTEICHCLQSISTKLSYIFHTEENLLFSDVVENQGTQPHKEGRYVHASVELFRE